MADIIFETKQFTWTRIGECNHCGLCCIDTDKDGKVIECPHLVWVKGKSTCSIHDRLDQDCEECNKIFDVEGRAGGSRNHKVCINFPDHPFLNCLKSKKCGFSFIKTIKESK